MASQRVVSFEKKQKKAHSFKQRNIKKKLERYDSDGEHSSSGEEIKEVIPKRDTNKRKRDEDKHTKKEKNHSMERKDKQAKKDIGKEKEKEKGKERKEKPKEKKRDKKKLNKEVEEEMPQEESADEEQESDAEENNSDADDEGDLPIDEIEEDQKNYPNIEEILHQDLKQKVPKIEKEGKKKSDHPSSTVEI